MCIFESALSINDEIKTAVLHTNDKLIHGFNLNFGITHSDYLYSFDDKKIYLVECAARGGGDYISSKLTPYASGFDTNTALIEYIAENFI